MHPVYLFGAGVTSYLGLAPISVPQAFLALCSPLPGRMGVHLDTWA